MIYHLPLDRGMTKWFLETERRPPESQEWQLNIAPCEEIEDIAQLLSSKKEITALIEQLNSAQSYYKWLETRYQQRASEICEASGGHDFQRSLYDPYSPMICIKCHTYRG